MERLDTLRIEENKGRYLYQGKRGSHVVDDFNAMLLIRAGLIKSMDELVNLNEEKEEQ